MTRALSFAGAPAGDGGREDWLPIREATALLGVSPATLRRWADAGQVVSWTTPGGHRRFERSALLSFLALERIHDRNGGSGPDHGTVPLEAPLRTAPGPVAVHGTSLRDEARHLTAALVACLQSTPSARDRAQRDADAAAVAFGAAARAAGVAPGEVITALHAVRLPLLRALSVSARLRGLDGQQASELFLEAVAIMDRLLRRSLASAHGASIERS